MLERILKLAIVEYFTVIANRRESEVGVRICILDLDITI
jgi:hypothetical protein